MKVEGCRVVITGGASGIGLAIARQLVDRGCQIVLADIDATALTNCADERDTFHTFACDVTQQEALEALADFSWATLGGVDLVFANAGVGLPLRPLLDHTEAHARWVMEVNYFGVWHTLQTFGPRLIEQGSQCHVVVTGSENSIAVPAPLLGAYNASKHAVLGLTETFDRETPDFLDIIRETPPGRNGEVQITDALQTQANKGCVLAYKFEGQRFDCGSVPGFVEATNFVYENLY